MRFSSLKRMFGEQWGGRGRKRSQAAGRGRRPARLELESLEDRNLMAVLPPLTVTGQTDFTPGLGAGSNTSAATTPTIAVDPINPQKLVAFFVEHDPGVGGNQKYFINGMFSTDGGFTWNSGMGVQGNDPDPAITPSLPYAVVSDVSVGMDRNENVYVVYTEHNPSQDLSGEIIFTKFSFTGNAPTNSNIAIVPGTGNDNRQRVLYHWFNPGATIISGYTPTVAVDSGVKTFTDPTTGAVQTDPTSGTVYVAFTEHVVNTPTGIVNIGRPFQTDRIKVTATSDGGNTFLPWRFLNTGFGGGVQENYSLMAQATPRMTVGQGTADGRVPGGQLTLVYDDFKTSNADRDRIMADTAPGGAGSEFFDNNFHPIINALQDPVSGNNIPQTTDLTLAVNITDPNFTSVSDLTMTITADHPDLGALSMRLIAPNGQSVLLFSNHTNANNTQNTGLGLSGANMGITTNGFDLGTTFQDNAAYWVNSTQATAPYIGPYRPENFAWNTNGNNPAFPIGPNTMALFNGLGKAAINGTWTLEIIDFVKVTPPQNGPPLEVRHWGLSFTSGLNFQPAVQVANGALKISGNNTDVLKPAHGNFNADYPGKPAVAPDQGIGPTPVVASNNTLGSFDPYQGRLYVAFTTGNGTDDDVRLAASDDGGRTWNVLVDPVWGINSIRVNDDVPQDNFSEGNRAQFLPEIAVDNYTGTLAISYYDARYDASNMRVAQTVALSIDGGQTFSPQTFVNAKQQATDTITGQKVDMGPITDNFSSGNGGRDTSQGYGAHEGLAIANGHVYPIWTGNENFLLLDGPPGQATQHILTPYATTSYSTAPNTVLPENPNTNTTTSTITIAGSSITNLTNMSVLLNLQDSLDSQLLITLTSPPTLSFPNGFTVTLSNHEGGPTGQNFTNTLFNDSASISLSSGAAPFTGTFLPDGFLGFFNFIGLTSPNGTWTLTITADSGTNNTGKLLNWSLQFSQGGAIIDNGPGILQDKSTLGGPVGTGTPPAETDFNGTVIPYNNLRKPDGTPIADGFVVNFDRPIDPNTITTANVQVMYRDVNTPASQAGQLLQVLSVTPVFDPNAPVYDPSDFSRTPAQKQLAFGPSRYLIRFQPPTGPSNGVGTYSYAILPVPQGGAPTQGIRDRIRNPINNGVLGAFMDPNTIFADPAPVNGVAFQLPYDPNTLPIIVPGPHVVKTFVSGTPSTPDNLVLNNTVSSIDVVFDRNMNPATFEASGVDVLRIIGPAGLIPGPYTVTPDPTNPSNPNGNDPDPSHPRTFRISFAPQQLSGTYTVTLSSNIQAASGLNGGDKLDTNLNAGLYVLRGVDPTSSSITTVTTNWIKVPQNQITPGNALITTINVPNSFAIQHATLQLNITFPNDPVLSGTLIAPDGTTILLFSGVGSSGTRANFNDTVFDDTAGTSIQQGTAPFNGSFNPLQSLDNALKGKNSAGIWTLVINDASSTDSGTLNSWSLSFDETNLGTGLGEPVADQVSATFRIFTTDPNNQLSQNKWTAIGPTGTIDAPTSATATKLASGEVNDITVDPSDPSGNTVYVAAASGGIWKTNNFLNPNGQPTYYPLTDFGPSASLYIGGMTVFARNNDPSQSIVFAATGNGDASTQNGGPNGIGAQGVGVLRSFNGGGTWSLLDSSTNVDGNGNLLPMNSPLRDHKFVGLTSFRIVVDPKPAPNGGVLVYMAVSDPAGQGRGGVWGSSDGGNHWLQLRAGQATDVQLDNNDISVSTGNRTRLFAAFVGDGVYQNTSQGQGAWTLLAGNSGNPLFRDITTAPSSQIPVANSPDTPSGAKGRIVLAVPAQGGTPVERLLYAGWLYAVVLNPGAGTLNGLYMTKDFGANWTKVPLPTSLATYFEDWGSLPAGATLGAFPEFGFPTNDNNAPSYDPTSAQGGFSISLAVDPTNPNIVYMGGSASQFLLPSGMLRIDVTQIQDAYSVVGYDWGLNDGGALLPNTGGAVVRVVGNVHGYPYGPVSVDFLTNQETIPIPFIINGLEFDTRSLNFLNVLKNPYNVFANATIDMLNIASIRNTGLGVKWSYLDQIYSPGHLNPADAWLPLTLGATSTVGSSSVFGGAPYEPATVDPSGYTSPLQGTTNVHRIVTTVDPITGKARLIFGDDAGVFTMVDDNGFPDAGIGTATTPGTMTPGVAPGLNNFSRNGNLQISQFFYGAAQPSSAAAQAAQALFYGAARDVGVPASDPNAFTNGNLLWNGGMPFFQASGQSVNADLSGSGSIFSYWWPGAGLPPSLTTPIQVNPTDFFQQDTKNTNRFLSNSRTFGLFVNTPTPPNAEWPFYGGSNFALNPISSDQAGNVVGQSEQIVMSSQTGNIYRTTNSGLNWSFIGNPGNSYAAAMVFGSRDPNNPFGRIDDFIYAGTQSGRVFVTVTGSFNAGGFTDITRATDGTQLDGSAIEQVVVNPTPGSHEIYVVTQAGVYHMVNTANPSHWENITGNLFAITANAFGDTTQALPLLKNLTSIQADWRFAIPDNPALPIGAKHPILYVAGDGGVFRSVDKGTWTRFPDDTGAQLPSGDVTSLNLVLGNVDPTTGKAIPDPANPGGYLLASLYGRGDFAIRLNNPTLPRITGITTTSSSAPIKGIIVTFNEPVDPNTFTLADINSFSGPNGSLMSQLAQFNSPRNIDNTLLKYEIDFSDQRAVGTYTINIGPNISDFAGFLMDQNNNGIPGENPGDQFIGQFNVVFVSGPQVIGQTNAADGSSFTLTFNKAINGGTFNPSQILVIHGGSSVTPTSITQTSATTFTVTLPPLGSNDTYSITIGPNIQDTLGNAMNQNGNNINGEFGLSPSGDQFGFTITTVPPVPQPPQITTFSPTHGTQGTSVVIAGSQFFGTTAVTFGGIPASFTVNGNGTQITATVPLGAQTGQIGVTNPAGTTLSAATFTVDQGPPPPPPVGDKIIVTGADAGGGPNVVLTDRTQNRTLLNFMAYDINFTGGVRVALGDINGDGHPDIVTAPGPGGGPDIHVYDGVSGALIGQFFAFNPLFTGGSNLAVGDVNRDGKADIIIGADAGGGPNISVFSGADFGRTRLTSFFAYNPNFTGGVRVASGDVNGDGFEDIIAGAGPGGGPNVSVFSGNGFNGIASFFAYDPRFNSGIYVAAADLNNSGRAQIICGAGAGGGPNVTVFDMNANALASFFAYDPRFTGGVRVAGIPFFVGNSTTPPNNGAIVTVAGPGGGADVHQYDINGNLLDQYFAYNPLFTGGLFVDAGRST